jgi:hypothetical protein
VVGRAVLVSVAVGLGADAPAVVGAGRGSLLTGAVLTVLYRRRPGADLSSMRR